MFSQARLDSFTHQLNAFRSCAIYPVGFSDHCVVQCMLKIGNVKPHNAYWHFNLVLLTNVNFVECFILFNFFKIL